MWKTRLFPNMKIISKMLLLINIIKICLTKFIYTYTEVIFEYEIYILINITFTLFNIG